MMFQLCVEDWSIHVIELSDKPCIRYVCVTQRKDHEEELLRALLGTSRWQYSGDPHNPLPHLVGAAGCPSILHSLLSRIASAEGKFCSD